jgi:hypothetical protein
VDDHQEGMKPLTWHLKATTGAFTWVPSAMTVRVGRGSHITWTLHTQHHSWGKCPFTETEQEVSS